MIKRGLLFTLFVCLSLFSKAQFNEKKFDFYFYSTVFKKNIVAEYNDEQRKSLELLFYIPSNTAAAEKYKKLSTTPPDEYKTKYGETDKMKIIRVMGVQNFRRYIVEVPKKNIKVAEAAGGDVLWTIVYPCTAGIYYFNGQWKQLEAKKQFTNADQIAAYINDIKQ